MRRGVLKYIIKFYPKIPRKKLLNFDVNEIVCRKYDQRKN